MNQIGRLRQRLKNVERNVVEYRMTVKEAKELLLEIDELLNRDMTVIMKPPAEQEVGTSRNIVDGGVL